MPNSLTNLLPPERRRQLSRDYLFRLGVVAAVLVMLLILAATALLIPSYFFLDSSQRAKEARLAKIQQSLAATNDAAISARLTALSNAAARLSALSDAPSASATIRTIFAVPRPGIMINGITYRAPTQKTPASVLLSGTAATRDALRTYQLALENVPFISSADLPVSAFAKDADIPFTITAMLTP